MCILFFVLFEVVFEIVGDFLHEVDAVFAHEVVFGAGVDEVVDRNVVGDASVEEVERVLIEDDVVDEALADEEFATKVLCLID